MIGRLSRGGDAVVTALAHTCNTGMVVSAFFPCRYGMTGLAIAVRTHMRLRFSRRGCPIMARDTGSGRTAKTAVGMTGLAWDGEMAAG